MPRPFAPPVRLRNRRRMEASAGALASATEFAAAPRRPAWLALAVSVRPYQWVKNTLVLSALVFSHSLLNVEAFALALAATAIFCAASSAVYLWNDLHDRDADRRHPKKRFRPLAAGEIGAVTAGVTMLLLAVGSCAAATWLGTGFAVIVGLFLLLNLAYSLGLKHVAILDVMVLSLGYVLRAVGGAVAIGVAASPWLLLCTFVLALLLAFGKRRHELTQLDPALATRASLAGYTAASLDLMIAVTAAAAIVTYALHTMALETVLRVGTHALLPTTLFVLYGVFRYLHLVYRETAGEDPAWLFVSDVPTLVNGALWLVSVSLVIYGGAAWWPW